ncbi:MAG: SLC13 family permease [Candidatus Omnitrophota bacterium]
MASKAIICGLLAIFLSLLASFLGLNSQQLAATTVFLAIICYTLFFWHLRLSFGLIGLTLLMSFGLLDTPHLIQYANLDVVLFLVGMMLVIGFMEERKFFEFVIEKILSLIKKNATKLVIVMLVAGFVSAALVDEVTSILFMCAIVLQLTRRYHLDPKPFVLMIVFCTNIGSSATVVGNPIGILIALRGGFTFMDFIRWASPVAIVALAIAIPFCLFFFRKDIKALQEAMDKEKGKPAVHVEPISRKNLRTCWALFIGTISLLVFHHQLEQLLHIEKYTLLLGVPLAAGGIALLLSGEGARELAEKRVDWWTLIFFIALFATVGTLKYTEVTQVVAARISDFSQGRPFALLAGVTWASGLLSAFLDNVLAVATFVPILADLKVLGFHTTPLWWGMLFGCAYGGNMTIIGSTANIVAAGLLERRKEGRFHFMEWFIPGLLVTLLTLIPATLLVYFQIALMPR